MSVTKRNLRPTVLSKNRKRAGARRRLHAVLVGINIYQDPRISNLQFAAADARTFHDALRRTLSAKELNTVLLMDAQATLSSVRRSIGEDLARAAERDDLVLLFFAGHGAPELDDLISPPNRYLIMNDTKYDQIFSTALGYSHPIVFDIPQGIDIAIDKQTHITVTGVDRQLVGQVAANIRRMRKPDPYKQKGVRYTGEVLKKKVGKTGAK
jgi:hypothetical protein